VKPLEKNPLTSDRRAARVDWLALGSLPTLWDLLVDLRGRPMPGVRALSPGRAVENFPRLSQLRWIGSGGRWVDLGSGANGDGVVSLVEWLSGAPHERCVAFLEETIAELDAQSAA